MQTILDDPIMSVKPLFHLDPAAVKDLELALSPPRLATYVQAGEVALRNALDRELGSTYGPSWYDQAAHVLPPQASPRIADARTELQRGGYPLNTPRLVAELTFGFWVSLVSRSADALWRACLHRAFRHARVRRDEVHRHLDHLRRLRNRIAHHEPIFGRHLAADHDSLLRVVGWICPTTRDWIAHHSRVPPLLALRPAECARF